MIDTSLTSTNFYFLLAVFQGVILASIILLKQPLRKTNIFFGILVFLLSLGLLHLVLEESISAFNTKFPIPMEFGLAYGPLTYLHILYIKDPKRAFSRRDLLHFLPTFLLDGVLFTSVFIYFRFNLEWAYDNLLTIQSVALVTAFIGAIQLSIYTYFIYIESKEAKRVLREFEKIKKWLNSLITAWSFLIGFIVFAIPVGLIFIEDVDDNSAFIYKPLCTLISAFIFFLGYTYLIKYTRLVENYTERVLKFSYSERELEDRKDQIISALEKEKLHQDSNLTIAKLASHLSWPINSLSSVINESLNTNFNDLINSFRIQEFKKRIIDPDSQKYSIVGLGLEVGFSSKASFYRAFKKETGMTPSDYIKSLS